MTLSPSPQPTPIKGEGQGLVDGECRAACKPGSVSRLLGRDGGHLSSPASVLAEAPASRCEPDCGQRCRWGRAANPGTSRTLIVPLFGLAPGGVWPPVRRRTRPGALTARFHPCRPRPGRLRPRPQTAVCFCATFRRRYACAHRRLGVTQHPVGWSPDFPPRNDCRLAAATRPFQRSPDPRLA